MDTSVGERIKLIRLKWGFTQEEVAKEAGISRIALGNYERGERTPPIDIFARIAIALHVSMDDLYGLDEPTKWDWIKKELNTHGFIVKRSTAHEGYILVMEVIPPLDSAIPVGDAPIEVREFAKEHWKKDEKENKKMSLSRPASIWEKFIGRWFYIVDEETLYYLLKKVTNSFTFNQMLSELYLNSLMAYSTRQLSEVQNSKYELSKDNLWNKILAVKK